MGGEDWACIDVSGLLVCSGVALVDGRLEGGDVPAVVEVSVE